MRLLHVSDWHLGRSLGRIARAPDHVVVLGEMLAIAKEARPDLIVHTGDLFDHARPSVDDLGLAIEALRDLAGVAPVVVLAGNHDSAGFFEVLDKVLALAGGPDQTRVRFLGRARHPRDGGLLEFPAGDEVVKLAPLPFVHPNSLLRAFDVPPEKWTADYHDQIGDIEELLGRALTHSYRPDRDVLLFAAHLHVANAKFSRSERALHISDAYATSTEQIPAVSYAAFGHIHRPQLLPGSVLGRYAGSPIQIDFGELDEAKSVVVVDAPAGAAAKVEVVALSGGRQLRRVEGTLEQLASLSDVDGCIVQAIVDTDDLVPDLADRLGSLWPNAAFFDIVDRCSATKATMAVDRPDQTEPPTDELFRAYLGDSGVPATRVDAAMGIFERLMASVDDDTEPHLAERELFELAVAPSHEQGET
jgi:exonuclease SbcD